MASQPLPPSRTTSVGPQSAGGMGASPATTPGGAGGNQQQNLNQIVSSDVLWLPQVLAFCFHRLRCDQHSLNTLASFDLDFALELPIWTGSRQFDLCLRIPDDSCPISWLRSPNYGLARNAHASHTREAVPFGTEHDRHALRGAAPSASSTPSTQAHSGSTATPITQATSSVNPGAADTKVGFDAKPAMPTKKVTSPSASSTLSTQTRPGITTASTV